MSESLQNHLAYQGIAIPSQYAPDLIGALSAMHVIPSFDDLPVDHDKTAQLLAEAYRVQNMRRHYPHLNNLTDVESLGDPSGPFDPRDAPPAFIFMGVREALVVDAGLTILTEKLLKTVQEEKITRGGNTYRTHPGLIALRQYNRLGHVSSMIISAAFKSTDSARRIIDTHYAPSQS